MITADQLVAHAVGDYILQSDWMATEKTKKTTAALAHVFMYSLPFLFLTRSPAALAFIVVTHFVIDRWRLARYVVWLKNYLGVGHFEVFPRDADGAPNRKEWIPANLPWSAVKDSFGYDPKTPAWLAMWLCIIADNTMHVLLNGLALAYSQ